jgi:hypothetical protein
MPANQMYKDYLIISRPRHNEVGTEWFVHVTISWQQTANLHFHTLTPQKSFQSEEEASHEGVRLGKLWIEGRL